MKLPPGTPRNIKPVVSVHVINVTSSAEVIGTIRAMRFSASNAFQEIDALEFVQSSTLTKSSSSSAPVVTDRTGIAGVPDYANQVDGSGKSRSSLAADGWKYRIYWHGSVSCYLDYLALDDSLGNTTFFGTSDPEIRQEVNNYISQDGLGRLKTRDEPFPSQYLAVGYTERIIDSIAR